uniref:Bcl-2 Bcl-2 homology region 1-3 domain-containing protein n=1 Tax=Pundamilia nyererei TaxID=303518 RepID=A0A3B4EXZ1_9CICH
MLSSELGSRVPNCVFSNRVIEEELKDVPSEDVPPLTPLTVEGKTEQEEKLVKQLSKMIRIVGDRVQHDQEFQDVIDGVASGSGSKSENFRRVADKVFEDGITWERIAVLIYVAGRLAVKVIALILSAKTAPRRRHNLMSSCWCCSHIILINVVPGSTLQVTSHIVVTSYFCDFGKKVLKNKL